LFPLLDTDFVLIGVMDLDVLVLVVFDVTKLMLFSNLFDGSSCIILFPADLILTEATDLVYPFLLGGVFNISKSLVVSSSVDLSLLFRLFDENFTLIRELDLDAFNLGDFDDMVLSFFSRLFNITSLFS